MSETTPDDVASSAVDGATVSASVSILASEPVTTEVTETMEHRATTTEETTAGESESGQSLRATEEAPSVSGGDVSDTATASVELSLGTPSETQLKTSGDDSSASTSPSASAPREEDDVSTASTSSTSVRLTLSDSSIALPESSREDPTHEATSDSPAPVLPAMARVGLAERARSEPALGVEVPKERASSSLRVSSSAAPLSLKKDKSLTSLVASELVSSYPDLISSHLISSHLISSHLIS